MTKYKYYFKKPKGEIAKDILLWIGAAGTVVVAITAPKFLGAVLKEFSKYYRHKKGSVESTFRRLLKDGSLDVNRRGHQIYIALTDKGRRKAGRLQINHLVIRRQRRWDGAWRIAIFDIAHTNRIVREALRGLLKRLMFYPLQKSVWIQPYPCRDEIDLLKDFFSLSEDELRLIVAKDIGNDRILRKKFDLL